MNAWWADENMGEPLWKLLRRRYLYRIVRVPAGIAWQFGTHSELTFTWDRFTLLDVWVVGRFRHFAVTLFNVTWHNLGQYGEM